MIKRILLLALLATMLFSAVACGETPVASGDRPKAGDVVIVDTGSTPHYVSADKTLHLKTVTDVGRQFVYEDALGNKTTDYKLLLGKFDADINQAGAFLKNQIEKATGAYVEMLYDRDGDLIIDGTDDSVNWTETSKYLVLEHSVLAESANVVWNSDVDLGYSGYMIKTVGDTVFMKVSTAYGYQMVVQSFLREVLGYEWYSSDTIVFTKDGATLPSLDIVEKPDFDFIYPAGYISPNDKFASGQTNNEVFVNIDGAFVHNSLIFLPPDAYFDSHPSWYSGKTGPDVMYESWYRTYYSRYFETNNETPSESKFKGAIPTQLCYSAHGDKAEYELMIDKAASRTIQYVKNSNGPVTITFTQQDNYEGCTCECCSAMKAEFGAISASYMMFVNDLEDEVTRRLNEEAESNGTEPIKLTMLFFAYSFTSDAPVGVDEAGAFVLAKNPDNTITYDGKEIELPYRKTYENGIVCNENVGCFFAPIDANYNESLYGDSPKNTEVRERLKKWGLLTETLYGWVYDTNFQNYLFPFNSYDAIIETARCLKENNAEFIFYQAQSEETEIGKNVYTTCFGTLKTYLALTVRFDVNVEQNELLDKFFDNYFREASGIMREYYEQLTTYLEVMEVENPSVFNGSIYSTFVSNAEYWPQPMMENLLSLCDEAFSKIEIYKESDPELYTSLRNHIMVETIFPRFVLCSSYNGTYSSETVLEMRQSFYDDCIELGIGLCGERKSLKPIFEAWGVE